MTEISDALQKMAGSLDVPVVALSQLNRAVEGRGGASGRSFRICASRARSSRMPTSCCCCFARPIT